MATKKPVKKAAKPAKKAVVKKAAPKKVAKPAPKKAAAKKPAPAKKAVAKKAVPASKKPVKKAAPKKVVAKKAAPKKAVPAKKIAPVSKKAAPSVKKTPAPKKAAPVKAVSKAAAQPVKKPTVAAPVHEQVKTNIKPIVKPQPVKKEEPKPKKVVIPKTSTTNSVKYDPDFTKSVLDKNGNKVEQGPATPTMRYSDAELNEFRELINRKLDAAKRELAYLQGLITRKDESGDLDEGRYMTMEDGSMSMEREQLSQMASRQIQFIDHLEKAIMRIENKTYGICRVTGKLIDKARLRAVPHATLSIEAKQMMNK
jgi:RNA polymerase-binding transcription factor DksA